MKYLETRELREICEHGTEGEGHEFHRMAHELLDRRTDEVMAAGELRVPLPIPGTDMARMLSANSIMRRKVQKLETQWNERMYDAERECERNNDRDPCDECAGCLLRQGIE